MNGKISKRLRKLAVKQTIQRPEFMESTYKKIKELYLHGSAYSKQFIRKAINSL